MVARDPLSVGGPHRVADASSERRDRANRSFAQILTGQAKGFDIALSEITITDERKKVLNFTEPYFDSDQAVLVKAGTKVDTQSMKKMRLGARQGTTTLQLVLAWGFVGIPLTLGVLQTLANSMKLFQ